MVARKPKLGRDLATLRPDLAAQAHGWDASTVSVSSNIKFQWICKKGHVWSASASHRSNGRGCPVCAGKQVLAGFNDLASTHPELAKQANGFDPSTVSFGSKKKLKWKCGIGHLWTTAVNNRSSGSGCPVCVGKIVVVGFNDLAATHPEFAAQAHGWDPTTVTFGSGKTMEWKCVFGHEWRAQINSRTNQNAGCPYCSNKRVIPGFNDLATTHPEIAAQAHGWDPKTIVAGSQSKFKWKCALGHTWLAVVASRTSGCCCPYCTNKKVLAGFNDLATTNPDLAVQACGWAPETLTAGSSKKVGWRCGHGHEWMDTVAHRSWGRGCPTCAGRLVLAGFNDLASAYPEIAKEAHGWDPETVTACSNRVLEWRCPQGHSWTSSVNNRSRGDGCPYCSNHKVLVGFNDLATTNPTLAAQAHGWDPTTVTEVSDKRRDWVCGEGHTWTAVVGSRSAGNGCPICAGKQVLVGFNDLATLHPELASQAHGWDPTTVTVKSGKRMAWKCSEDHVWQTAVGHRSVGNGCPSCAEYGFDPAKPGWLYLMEHPKRGLYQIGISNVIEQRLKTHKRKGWVLVDISAEMPGAVAHDYEQGGRRAISRRGGIFTNHYGSEKSGGYSEVWKKSSLHIRSIAELMKMVDIDRRADAA